MDFRSLTYVKASPQRFIIADPCCCCYNMTLTDKQTVDLNASIMEYLLHKGYKNAAAAFNNDIAEEGTETELRTPPPPTTTTAAANSNVIPLLEKKWTSIVRLSKKVADLERQLASAKSKGLTEETDPNSVTRNKSRLLPTNTILKSLEGHRGSVTCTDLHPTYTILASSSDDGTIKIWDVESGTFEKTLKGHSNAVNSVNFSHSGDLLASSSMDMSIKIWDVKQNYVCVNTLNGHEHNVSMAKFLATDSSSLVSVSRDKTVKFWDLKTGYCVNTNAFAHNDWVRCVSIRNDGELIATGSNDKSIAVFKLTDGELKKATVCLTIEAHDHHIEVSKGYNCGCCDYCDNFGEILAVKCVVLGKLLQKLCVQKLNLTPNRTVCGFSAQKSGQD